MRSILSSRSLHLALGVTVGSLVPRLLPWLRLRSRLPTRGGGAGGSHFFFGLSCPAGRPYLACGEVTQQAAACRVASVLAANAAPLLGYKHTGLRLLRGAPERCSVCQQWRSGPGPSCRPDQADQ